MKERKSALTEVTYFPCLYSKAFIPNLLSLLFLIKCVATADDMGLGKTLTMIALMLTKKMEAKKEGEKKEEKKLDSWISKSGDSYLLSVNPSFFLKIQLGD